MQYIQLTNQIYRFSYFNFNSIRFKKVSLLHDFFNNPTDTYEEAIKLTV